MNYFWVMFGFRKILKRKKNIKKNDVLIINFIIKTIKEN